MIERGFRVDAGLGACGVLAAGVLVCVAVGGLAGCGEEAEPPLFDAGTVRSEVEAFLEDVYAQDAQKVAERCALPFHCQALTWKDRKALLAGLQLQLPRMKQRLEGGDLQLELLPVSKLRAGEWPRGRQLDEAQADTELRRLGVGSEGWLVRAHSPGSAGLWLVLGQSSGAGLGKPRVSRWMNAP